MFVISGDSHEPGKRKLKMSLKSRRSDLLNILSFLSPGILTISGASSFMGFLKVKNVFHDLLVINPVDINKVNKQKIPAYFYWFILVILSIVNGNL